MKRRWILRSFFLGLLLLCGAGWVASYTYTPLAMYSVKHQAFSAVLERGSLFVSWDTWPEENTGHYSE